MTIKRTALLRWLPLLLLVLVLYVILPQLAVFKHSLGALQEANWSDVLFAVLASMATYFAAAATYCLLARRPLRYSRTLVVQLASMFTNRLLPAGIGGIGTNYLYLRKNRHSAAQAAGVVTANNILGFVGNALVLGVLLAFEPRQIGRLHVSLHPNIVAWCLGLGLVLIVAGLVLGRRFRQRLETGLLSVYKQLLRYRSQPGRLGAALLSSALLTLANIVSFYACARALHIGLSFIVLALIFSIGVLVGTATPTPGGLGGVEAGMIAALVAAHVTATHALTVVLLYRLVSYWLALLVGAVAFIVASRRKYFTL